VLKEIPIKVHKDLLVHKVDRVTRDLKVILELKE
jgi:hypothetical protein